MVSDHENLPLSWARDPTDRQRQLSPKRNLIGGFELGRVAHNFVLKFTGEPRISCVQIGCGTLQGSRGSALGVSHICTKGRSSGEGDA